MKVRHNSTKINDELYNAIATLFQLLERQTQMPEDKVMGLDGEISYFSTTKEGETTTGETWSPNEKSPMGHLVEICKQLYLIGAGKNISQSGVLAAINQLKVNLER